MKQDARKQLLAVLIAVACMIVLTCLFTSCHHEGGGADDTATTAGAAGTEAVETTAVATAAPEESESVSSTDTEAATEEETEPVETEPTPTFSVEGGLYTDDLTVELTASEEYEIYYTLDGSVPAMKTSRTKKYTEPICVAVGDGEKGTVIRAACFADGVLVGNVTTETYVPVKAKASTLYTVMISVDKIDLNNMTSNYTQKIERPAHVEIVTPEGERVISQDAGLRLFGGSSRDQAQKSFKITARREGYFGEDAVYTGKGTFHYELFPNRIVKAGKDAGEVLDRYDSFILRNGGNDSMLATNCEPLSPSLIRDGLANNFASQVAPHVDTSYSQFAAVYINGEYYGLLDMRENQNENYVRRVYGVDDEDVVVIKSELDTTKRCRNHDNGAFCRFCGSWFFYESEEGNMTARRAMNAWKTLCKDAIAAINADDATYDAMYEQVSASLDMENFKEYMALGLFLCNTDWPHNNVKLWKYTGDAIEGIDVTDGKWRFMTRDMDMSMARYDSAHVLPELDSTYDADMFWRVLGNYKSYYGYSNSGTTQLYSDALYIQGLFVFCMRNDDFRTAFSAYCNELAGSESKALLADLCDELEAQIAPEIERHIDRWSYANSGYTASHWQASVKKVEQFISRRHTYFKADLDAACALFE